MNECGPSHRAVVAALARHDGHIFVRVDPPASAMGRWRAAMIKGGHGPVVLAFGNTRHEARLRLVYASLAVCPAPR